MFLIFPVQASLSDGNDFQMIQNLPFFYSTFFFMKLQKLQSSNFMDQQNKDANSNHQHHQILKLAVNSYVNKHVQLHHPFITHLPLTHHSHHLLNNRHFLIKNIHKDLQNHLHPLKSMKTYARNSQNPHISIENHSPSRLLKTPSHQNSPLSFSERCYLQQDNGRNHNGRIQSKKEDESKNVFLHEILQKIRRQQMNKAQKPIAKYAKGQNQTMNQTRSRSFSKKTQTIFSRTLMSKANETKERRLSDSKNYLNRTMKYFHADESDLGSRKIELRINDYKIELKQRKEGLNCTFYH